MFQKAWNGSCPRQLAASLTQLARLAGLEGQADDAAEDDTRAAGVYEALDLEAPAQRMRKRKRKRAEEAGKGTAGR